MRSRRLVLVRHGQTVWNADGRLQGQSDIELDDCGHDQAATSATHVAGYRPVALWTSDLVRARQTAAHIAKETGLEARADRRLRELDLGECSGQLKSDYARDHPHLYAALMADDFSQLPGAESLSEIAERFGSGLVELLASLGQGETGVVVAHGTAIKVGICSLLGWPADQATGFAGMGNCHWAVLEECESRFRLEAYDLGAPPPPPRQ